MRETIFVLKHQAAALLVKVEVVILKKGQQLQKRLLSIFFLLINIFLIPSFFFMEHKLTNYHKERKPISLRHAPVQIPTVSISRFAITH